MNDFLRKQVEKELDRHHAAMDSLANALVKIGVDAFRKKFPKRRLSILFGMGTELISIDGDNVEFYWNPSSRSVIWSDEYPEGRVIPAAWSIEWRNCHVKPETVDMLCVMLNDLLEVTDGYREACPDNVKEKDQ